MLLQCMKIATEIVHTKKVFDKELASKQYLGFIDNIVLLRMQLKFQVVVMNDILAVGDCMKKIQENSQKE